MNTIKTKNGVMMLLADDDGPMNTETTDRLFVCDIIGGLGYVGAVSSIVSGAKGDRANELLCKLPGLMAVNDFIRALPKTKGGQL